MYKTAKIVNHWSIRDIDLELSPFTLLIGDHGSGKTNILRALHAPGYGDRGINGIVFEKHVKGLGDDQYAELIDADGARLRQSDSSVGHSLNSLIDLEFTSILDRYADAVEFDRLERIFDRFMQLFPDTRKLWYKHGSEGECNAVIVDIDESEPVEIPMLQDAALAEMIPRGIISVLSLLTAIEESTGRGILTIDDITCGIHPRLFNRLFEMIMDLNGDPQIVATTYNPMFLDHFYGYEDAVIVVEMVNGETVVAKLSDKMIGLESDGPLGDLWYSRVLEGW